MSASVTLTKKFENRKLKEPSKSIFKIILKSRVKVYLKFETDSKFPESNCKGKCKTIVKEQFKIDCYKESL